MLASEITCRRRSVACSKSNHAISGIQVVFCVDIPRGLLPMLLLLAFRPSRSFPQVICTNTDSFVSFLAAGRRPVPFEFAFDHFARRLPTGPVAVVEFPSPWSSPSRRREYVQNRSGSSKFLRGSKSTNLDSRAAGAGETRAELAIPKAEAKLHMR